MKKCKLTRSTIFSYMFVSFFRIFTHRRITFDKNKKSKNKRVTFGNSGTKIKNRSIQRRTTELYISQVSSELTFLEKYLEKYLVKFLEKYLQKTNFEISRDGETHLVGRNFKTKKGNKILKTQGISYSRIREVFKEYITDITKKS